MFCKKITYYNDHINDSKRQYESADNWASITIGDKFPTLSTLDALISIEKTNNQPAIISTTINKWKQNIINYICPEGFSWFTFIGG